MILMKSRVVFNSIEINCTILKILSLDKIFDTNKANITFITIEKERKKKITWKISPPQMRPHTRGNTKTPNTQVVHKMRCDFD